MGYLKDIITNLSPSKQMKYAQMLSGQTPIFAQFGRSIYASDVVQMCIDCIASECSKLQPRHIRRNSSGNIINLPGDNLNRIFKYAPNELMSTKDFIERIVWNLLLNYNSFIFPTYSITYDANGNASKNYTAFYPLNPTQVDFLQDETGKIFVKFYFENGSNSTLAYSDVIHLRKKYSVNDIMGGGINGQPDNSALLKVIEINDIVLQGMGKAVVSTLSIRGIQKINTMMESEQQRAERERLEKQIVDGESGIITTDLVSTYTPITIDPKVIDTSTLEFLDNKILRWYGVSLPILNGTASDDEQQAFYNKTIEPIVVGLWQAFTSTVFTITEQNFGNEIMFFNSLLETMSVKNKLAIIDGLGGRGAITNNQLLSLFGIEPYEGGDIRVMSLNYINSAFADSYQLARAGIEAKTTNVAETGGK